MGRLPIHHKHSMPRASTAHRLRLVLNKETKKGEGKNEHHSTRSFNFALTRREHPCRRFTSQRPFRNNLYPPFFNVSRHTAAQQWLQIPHFFRDCPGALRLWRHGGKTLPGSVNNDNAGQQGEATHCWAVQWRLSRMCAAEKGAK